MNMIDRASMVPPPAPQPPGLRCLRVASAALLLLSALSVARIHGIKAISIYAVAVVPVIMGTAIVVTTIYWIKRSRLETAYWTDERYNGHVAGAVDRLRAGPARRNTTRGRR